MEVERRNSEEEWDVIHKQRVVFVAVRRKKKLTVDAVKSLVNVGFPSLSSLKLDSHSLRAKGEPSEPIVSLQVILSN